MSKGSKKRPKLVELAKEFEVNVGTISRALNNKPGVSEDLRRRIKARASEVSYRPNMFAQSLITNKSYLLGVIAQVRLQAFFDNFFWGRIMSGIEEEASHHGYDLLFSGGHHYDEEDKPHVPRFVEQQRVDGVIFVNAVPEHTIQALRENRIPCVQVDFNEYDEYDAVVIEQRASMCKLVGSVIELGHKNLLFFGDPWRHANIRARLEGFQDAIESASVNGHSLTRSESEKITKMEEFRDILLRKLKEHPEVTAICCENDTVALSVKTALLQHGIMIPDQISISGFDDLSFSEYIYPSLTTVHVSKRLVGHTAIRRLMERIENGEDKEWAPHVVTYPAKPIMRQSTAGPRSGILQI